MRTIGLAVAAVLAGSLVTAEASAMRLVEFEFEGMADEVRAWHPTFGYIGSDRPISGRITINLDAPDKGDDTWSRYDEAVRDVSLSLELPLGPVTGGYSSDFIYTSDEIVLPPLRGVSLVSQPRFPQQSDSLRIGSFLSNEPSYLGSRSSTFFQSGADYFVTLSIFEMSSFSPDDLIDTNDLTLANILSMADQGFGFRIFGDTIAVGSPSGPVVSPDVYVEPSTHGFRASGTITSFTVPQPVPLPAAAWLLLSALAALAGVKAWPRLRRA